MRAPDRTESACMPSNGGVVGREEHRRRPRAEDLPPAQELRDDVAALSKKATHAGSALAFGRVAIGVKARSPPWKIAVPIALAASIAEDDWSFATEEEQ